MLAGIGFLVLLFLLFLAVTALENLIARFFLVALLVAAPVQASPSQVDLFSRLALSSVSIATNLGSGSGTVLYNDKKNVVVLTCAHVVPEKSAYIGLLFLDGTVAPGQLLKRDADKDLALVLAAWDGREFPPALPIAAEAPRIFSQLYSVFSPMLEPHTIAIQLLTSKGKDFWKFTGLSMYGASGGMIATDEAELVCVVEGIKTFDRYKVPIPITAMGSCIPLPTIQKFLEGYKL